MTSPTRRPATRTTLLAVALAGAFAFAAPFAAADRPTPQGHDQFIVRFKDGSVEHRQAAARQQRLDAVGRAQGLRLGQLRRLAVGADVIRTDRPLDPAGVKALINQLRADPRVAYAEVDARVYPAFTPDDPQYASQWHYSEAVAGINLPGAWDVTTGSGEVVAVIDTGITAHPDLAGNLVAGYDFIANTTVANDGDGRDADPSDPGDWSASSQCGPYPARASSWHGTHVAGTVGAVTDNALGVAGVAHGAQVQPIRVLGTCGGYSSDINDAIVWAAGGSVAGVADNPTPASVINLSLGGSGACGEATQAAIDTAVANGATIVVAAGNNNIDVAGFQPANCANVITVAAVGRGGARASYSNFGAGIELAAPGGDAPELVLSTINAGATTPTTPAYVGYQGTSMAAPHVAGVAALAQAASGGTLTPAEIATLLATTARTLPGACPQGCGAGIVDAHAAVVAATTAVLLVSDPVAADEGDAGTRALTFTVKLSRPVAEDVVFDLATVDGSATEGSDYVGRTLPAQVIPAGATTLDVTVDVHGDTVAEEDESFSLLLDNITGPVTVLDDVGTGRIPNDDPTVLTGNVPMTIADGTARHFRYFTVDVPPQAVDLRFTLAGGTGDADLWARRGQRPTTAIHDCSTIRRDTQSELCWPSYSNGGTPAGTWHVMVGAYTAYDDVTLLASYTLQPEIRISDASLLEGDSYPDKKMTFTVTLSKPSDWPVSFNLTTTDGTATGSDYFPPQGYQLQIPAGQLSKTVTADIHGDTTIEADETFDVELWDVMGAYVADASATGTILDDDTPKLSIADVITTEGNEGTKAMTFVVKLAKAAAIPVTYDIATSDLTAIAGEDYVATAFTGRTIPAGQLAQAFTVTLNGDTGLEANEYLLVDVGNTTATVVDGQAVGVVQNDDGPTLSINDFGYQEGNSGQKTMTFTVSLSQASAVPVTFTIATGGGTAVNGIDYTGIAPRTVTIPAGSLSRQILVNTQGDTAVEGNETFFVYLSNASVSMTDSQGRGSLINDDGPTLSIRDAPDVNQGGAPNGITWMTFVVELSQPMTKPATFNLSTADGTAQAGSDYQATSLVGATIPAGQTSMTFSVGIYGYRAGDALFETVQVNLSMGNVSIVDGVASGRIRR